MLKLVAKVLLMPFSLLYHLVTRLRNHLYDIGYKKSFTFNGPVVICIGNLSVGGTGKTPMVEYLVRLLKEKYQTATLSRGYGRKTQGFRVASSDDNARTLGDEPYQFYTKFASEIMVAVGESRALAIPFMLAERPGLQAILLDDAFQHRSVAPHFTILLTTYQQPFFSDRVLPAGRLRESRVGAKRAHAVIVTKCPNAISEKEMGFYEANIKEYTKVDTPVFFTKLAYATPIAFDKLSELRPGGEAFLFSGIANPDNLKSYVAEKFGLLKFVQFADHHDYTPKDVKRLIESFDALPASEKFLLTTEKDMVKLVSPVLQPLLKGVPIFYLPIAVEFVKDGKAFDGIISDSFEQHLVI